MTLYIADIKKIRHTFYMQRKHDSDIEILTFIMTYLLELERTYRKESITFIDYIDGIGAFNDLREIDFIGNYHEVNFESTIDNPYLLKVLKNMMIPNLRCGVLDPIVEKPLGALEKEQTCRTIMEEHRREIALLTARKAILQKCQKDTLELLKEYSNTIDEYNLKYKVNRKLLIELRNHGHNELYTKYAKIFTFPL